MRIRKRFPPSSLSSSLPLSDPQLSSSVLVVQPHIQPHLYGNLAVQQEVKTNPTQSDPYNQPLQLPTGREMVIGTGNPILVCALNSTSTQEQVKQKKEIQGKEIKDERWKTEEEKKISNDIRKESVLSAEMDMQFPQSSSSSSQAFDRWGEGAHRIVPPKKRKGSFERMGCKEMIKPKMKSKTNKKCLQLQNVDQDHEKKANYKQGSVDTKSTITSSTKKSKRGSAIMEGSRCSRVNGRGWRCCQQTLVGYSLCEHHLGKGRLRSMTSVRNRAMAHNISSTTAAHEDDDDHHHQNQNVNETARLTQKQDQMMTKSSSTTNKIGHVVAPDQVNERKPYMMSRKKRMMKIGAVKARSISSLLGQTDSTGAAARS